MSLPRIYADFHNLDDENRVRLTCAGTARDIERLGIELTEGMRVTLYTDDADDLGRSDEMFVEGLIRFSDPDRSWVAVVDWTAVRHASDVQPVNGVAGAVPTARPPAA